MTVATHVAAADCERCRPGPIAQPVNTLSSGAFVVAGLALIARTRARNRRTSEVDAPIGGHQEVALGWAAVTAGLGSVAYHGPGTHGGRVLHDASLLTMLGMLVLADVARVTRRPPPSALTAALPAVATLAAVSPWSMIAQVGLGAGAVVAEVTRVGTDRAANRRRWRPATEAVIAAVGATGHVLGRTGGPLCRPGSPWQAHAVWHVAMATVLVLRD